MFHSIVSLSHGLIKTGHVVRTILGINLCRQIIYIYFSFSLLDLFVELVGGGSVINSHYPV